MRIIIVIIVRIMFVSMLFLLEWSFIPSSYSQTLMQSMPLYKKAVPESISKQYPVLPYKFIDLIKAIPKPLPASLKKFQKIFNNALYLDTKNDLSIEYAPAIRYAAGPFETLDGVVIQKIGKSTDIKKKAYVQAFYMDLDPKQCVNTQLLKKTFGFIVPKLLSVHPVPNAPVDYNTTDERGYFAMRVGMDYPDCAESIGIAMFSDKQEKKEWIQYVRKQAPHLR